MLHRQVDDEPERDEDNTLSRAGRGGLTGSAVARNGDPRLHALVERPTAREDGHKPLLGGRFEYSFARKAHEHTADSCP